jgi:hypothetical protein
MLKGGCPFKGRSPFFVWGGYPPAGGCSPFYTCEGTLSEGALPVYCMQYFLMNKIFP